MHAVREERAELTEVDLFYRVAGTGQDLVVLLHGWPQTSLCWRAVIGPLAENHTVIAPDLRGYGDSGLAGTGYDKRATARDLSELVHHLGRESAIVIGHDRGARVAHRWALDNPSDVSALALLDILPTRVVMDTYGPVSAARLWHWFFHLQPGLPEVLLQGNVEPYLRHFMGGILASGALDQDTFARYVEAFSEPGHLSASMADYRAGFGADLELDRADHARGLRLQAPLLVLWGARGGLAGEDVVGIWGEHHHDPAAVTGRALPSGHYLPEETPTQVVDAVEAFLGQVRAASPRSPAA